MVVLHVGVIARLVVTTDKGPASHITVIGLTGV